MLLTSHRACAVLELTVLVLQIAGVLGLCLWRLTPDRRWAGRGRILLILVLLGLGGVGGVLGTQDSEFALFAGGTITVLLIGMTWGTGSSEVSGSAPQLAIDSQLAA